MSLLQTVKTVYRGLPPWSTAWLRFVPDEVLFGKGYRTTAPSVDLTLVGPNLKKALDYSRAHTAWGRENVPEKIDADEADALIQTLPTVTSDELAAEPERFVSDTATANNSYWTTTGGTGRKPTGICLSNASYGMEWKHIHAIWGVDYSRRNDMKLTFRGYRLKEGELVRFDPIYNELSVDSFQMNERNFNLFLRKVRGYRVNCLHGYPSLIALFMERLRAAGETFDVGLVFLGSEGASPNWKRQIGEFFHAKVLSWYGLSEKVVLAYNTDMSDKFVNFSSYGYPWIRYPDEDGVGEIVGTTFVNEAMPLVNYRTGDYGRIRRQRLDDGREVLVLDSLHGRWGKDFVYRTSREKIPTSAINLHSGIQRKIVFYQLVQEEFGRLLVKVLPKEGCSASAVCAELESELSAKLKGFEISCRAVKRDQEFQRSARGKLMMLVQSVKASDK